MEVDYKAIGQRIKIARIKKGVTQETVADLIDITPAHMSNVETGKTKVSLPTLIAIAKALSVSVDTLLCDNVITSKIVFEKEAKISYCIIGTFISKPYLKTVDNVGFFKRCP